MNRVLLVRWLEEIDVAACQIQMNFQTNAYCFQIHLLLGASTAKLSMPVSKNEPKCRNIKYMFCFIPSGIYEWYTKSSYVSKLTKSMLASKLFCMYFQSNSIPLAPTHRNITLVSRKSAKAHPTPAVRI